MGRPFDVSTLADALDRLALAASAEGVTLDIAVYGGSALMLASNFRYASEDVDVRVIGEAWPSWLTGAVVRIGAELDLPEDWLNDHVVVHLSREASEKFDHLLLGTFPRGRSEVGLRVFVPSAEYMLALKLKAMRVLDPAKGAQESADIVNLMRVVGCEGADGAIAILAKFFPVSAAEPQKQLFLLRHLLETEAVDAPRYPVRSL